MKTLIQVPKLSKICYNTGMLEGIIAVREFPKITGKMTQKEGIKLLAGRLGLTGGKLQELVRDRYPVGNPKEEKRGLKTCTVKCFLKSDIMFTDILHTDYEELKYLGIGRRYLINKILRAVVSGTCDSIDPTGKAGDFPPRSWMNSVKAEKMRIIQEKSLNIVKVENARLLQSVKVRLRSVATHILVYMAMHCDAIRTTVHRSALIDKSSGLRCLSDLLIAYRDKFYRRVRSDDLKNRRRARRKSKFHRKRTESFGTVSRRLAHAGFGVLYRGVTDLRKLLDPEIPNWYRRPTDEDWTEGMRNGHRIPKTFCRKAMFRRYGLGPIPGLTVPVQDSDWNDLKTDWSVKEAKDLFKNSCQTFQTCQKI